MGARLVAASLPIYALGVAVALFLWRQADPNEHALFWGLGYGGLIALAALSILLAGAATARIFDRRTVVVVGITFLLAFVLVVIFAVGRSMAGDTGPFYLAVYGSWLLAAGSFLAYAVTYRALGSSEPAVASETLSRTAAFVIAVVLGPLVLGPHYWPDSTDERSATVIAVACIIALGSAVALLVGASALRLEPRTARIALSIVAVAQIALFARGLPNPPMTLASVPPLTLEYPADRTDLSADAATYSARLALFVRRSGVVLPAQGVYVRYRWDFGPEDPAPPSGAVLVSLNALDMDRPDRTDRFADEASTALIPQPDWRRPGTYSPWRGFITWARTPDGPESDALIVKLCDLLLNKNSTPFAELDRAPYLRLERDGGAEAARSLYASAMRSPPEIKDWNALVRSACVSFLRR